MKIRMGVCIALLCATALGVYGEESYFLRLGGILTMPKAGIYTEIYGKSQVGLEARLSVRLLGGLGIWGGYGYINARGQTAELQSETHFKENIFMAGINYQFKLANWLRLLVDTGYIRLTDSEEAHNDPAVTGSGNGWLAELGFAVRPMRLIGLVISGGYQNLVDRSADPEINFSGLRFNLALELRL